MDQMSERVFVYGTLKCRGSNHHVMAHVGGVFETMAGIIGKIYNLGMYPGYKQGREGCVVGEIYRVTPEALSSLDWFEGEPNLYKRVKIKSSHGDVWVYEYQGDVEEENLIKNGEW